MKRLLTLLVATLTLGAGGAPDVSLGARWAFRAPAGTQRFHLFQRWSEVSQLQPPGQPGNSAASRAVMEQALQTISEVARSEGLEAVCSVVELARQSLTAVLEPASPVAPTPAASPNPFALLSQVMPNLPLTSTAAVQPSSSDTVTLDEGLLLGRRNDAVGSLTAWKPGWELLCDERTVGTTAEPLASWEAELGRPDEIWTHPKKTDALHLHRAGLAEVWLQVVHDQVPAALLVEPGSLEGALRNRGYAPSAPARETKPEANSPESPRAPTP